MPNNIQYIKKQTTIQLVANFIIGGLIAYFMTKSLPQVNLWPDLANIERTAIAVDFVMGSFFMALILSVIYALLTRKAKQTGELDAEAASGKIAKLPQGTVKRALMLALVSLLIFGLSTLVLMVIFGIDALSPLTFVGLKALLSGAEAAFVTTVIIRRELMA